MKFTIINQAIVYYFSFFVIFQIKTNYYTLKFDNDYAKFLFIKCDIPN